ncbi:MAG: hypothetical protein ACE37H_04880 [Phycisphaeraceae bacterium]
MLRLDTDIRLDLALAIAQVSAVARKFQWDLDDQIREGIAEQLLTCITFFLVRHVEPRLREIHGIVYVDVIYKEGQSPQFNVRWEPGEGRDSLEIEQQELCGNFDAVIDRILQLAESASGCYWASSTDAVPTPEGDAFLKKHGCRGNGSGIRYVDLTKPISQPIPNSHTDAVALRIRASDALMDRELN